MARTTGPGRRIAIGPALRFMAGKLSSYLPVHTHTTTGGTGGPIDASDITYTPADVTDWNGSVDPGNANQALDQLADRVTAGGVSFGSPTGAIDIGDSQTDGSASTVPHSDHQHAFPAPSAGYPQDVAGTEADGSASTPARSDHIHKGVASVNGQVGAVTIGGTGGVSPGRINDPATVSFIKDDFEPNGTGNGAVGELNWFISQSTVGKLAAEAGFPGIIQRNFTTTIASLHNSNTNGAGSHTDDTFDILFKLRPNRVDNVVQLRFGLMVNVTADPPTDGIYFEKLTTDTNWFGVCRSGSSENRVDMTVPAATGAFITFRIRRTSGSNIEFTVGSTSKNQASTIPSAGVVFTFQSKTTAGTENFDIDYWDKLTTGLSR